MSPLRIAALALGVLALVAGGLQIWAYVATGFPRHLVVGSFAVAVGLCVTGAAVGAVLRGRR